MGLNMKERQAVAREYRPRYQKAGKKGKKALLDEFVMLTGFHREHAARVLRVRPAGQAAKPVPGKKRPGNRKGKPVYDEDTVDCLRKVWAFFWYKCGRILAPLMRQQMACIAQWPAFGITAEIAEKLGRISPATIDRRLKKDRDALRLKGKSLTKPVGSLKSLIPVRTFYTSEERKKPGFWQTDTVHHCGQSTHGQYLLTLSATDVFSGWFEPRSLLNKAHKWAFEALSDVRASAPLPVIEFHSDNGSEFINDATEAWCRTEGIAFTRSRSREKNDNCFVEQKNGAVVREYIGYDRLEGEGEQAMLAEIYRHLAPLLNYFMPTRRLVSKTRVGPKEVKVHDEPRSPFRRLMESGEVPPETKAVLRERIALYNPVELQQNVNDAVMRLRRRLAQPNRKTDGVRG